MIRFPFASAVVSVACLLLFAPLLAQTTIKLWQDGPPGAKLDPGYKEETSDSNGRTFIRKVTDPTLTVYLAAPEKANGAAVVICPGGGYGGLAMSHEGHEIATWLNEMGVAGIILKYRLPSDAIMANKTVGPLQDVQEAIRTVRRRASEWRINPGKVGVMGFSAGGHLAATASTLYADPVYSPADSIGARPDFSILLYPVITMKTSTHGGSKLNLLGKSPAQETVEKYSNEMQVNAQTPPAFLVHSTDDTGVPVVNSILYYQALAKNGVPAELHIYEKGGHGYGLARNRGTESNWPEACRRWLAARGLLR